MTSALDGTAIEPILFVTSCPFDARIAKVFPQMKPLGEMVVRSGPTSQRVYRTFLLGGLGTYSGPITPLGPCAR